MNGFKQGFEFMRPFLEVAFITVGSGIAFLGLLYLTLSISEDVSSRRKKKLKDKEEFERVKDGYEIDETSLNRIDGFVKVKALVKKRKNKYEKEYRIYTFNTTREVYARIKLEIYEPVNDFSEEIALPHFYESIHYSLGFLENFVKIGKIEDIHDEIDNIVEIVKEMQSFIHHIEESANKEVTEFKEKLAKEIQRNHRKVLEDARGGLKVLNNTPVPIDKQEKEKVLPVWEVDNEK